jgi:hypothetical protein
MKKAVKKKNDLGKFEKFDKAEKEIKEAENSVADLGKDCENEDEKELVTKAARDLEKAEAEIEEADEHSF